MTHDRAEQPPRPHPGQAYWRTLQELAAGRTAEGDLHGEFPPAATAPPDGMTRRTMLSLMGASLALAGLTACRRPVERIVPYVVAPETVVPGMPRYFATAMPFGNEALGVVVESHEGRPTKIDGNDRHPATGGRANPWVQAAILDLYDPDRSSSVLQRVAGRLEPRTWQDFVAAWRLLAAGLAGQGGEGLAVLAEPFASPTLARLAQQLRQRYPKAVLVAHEPIGDEAILEGVRLATGDRLQPLYSFDRSAVVLALDSDFLLTESDAIRNARGFAKGRQIESAASQPSRLFVVESTFSLTGANAEHRLGLPPREVPAFLLRLAIELETRGVDVGTPTGLTVEPLAEAGERWIGALGQELAAARGRSLILAGRRQPPVVHALVLALNGALGNLGQTVSYCEPKDSALTSAAGLGELVAKMNAGAVSTLVMLGGNPVYEAPADLDLKAALAKVASSIHLGSRLDETSSEVLWHIPAAHFLEAWGDTRALGGALSVVQPLIAPLLGGKSAVELLGLVATGEERGGYDWVRESWQAILGPTDFEKRWRRVLHDGILERSELPRVVPRLRAGVAGEVVSRLASRAEGLAVGAGLEAVFVASAAVYDGRFANNAWLQELPDPLTKLTWDNAALIGPRTAADRGLAAGDVVALRTQGRQLELPVFVLPGHPEGVVSVPLGYGRTAAGRVGNGVGGSGYQLRTTAALGHASDLTLEPTGRRHELAQTQEHGRMAGRPIIREETVAGYRERPAFARDAVELRSLWEEHRYDSGYQWGMAIDLNACIGCSACMVACQSENNVPVVGKRQVILGREMQWLRVDRYFAGAPEDPAARFQPMPCQHCENAPCEEVCPVAATVHDREGLNTMVYNRCIGTRYCSNNCPYKVRRFNYFNYTKDLPELVRIAQNPDVTVRSRGVMEKCTYCIQRLSEAKIRARREGRELRDGEVQTACQQTCPTDAIAFGNILDPASRVAQLKAQERNYVVLAELNNKPRTSYLAIVRNPHPELAR